MSRVKGSYNTPTPIDVEAVAREQARQELLAQNSTLQSGIARARALDIENRRGELTAAFSDLRRMKLSASQGNFQASVAGYGRVYQRIQRLALAIANATGQAVDVPEFDPPTDDMGARMSTIQPADVAPGLYKETGGLGPSGKGLPSAAPAPDSGLGTEDGQWLK